MNTIISAPIALVDDSLFLDDDGSIEHWNLATHPLTQQRVLGLADGVIYVALTVKGRNLTSTDKIGAVRVFDVETVEVTKCLYADGDERSVRAEKFCGKDNGVIVYRKRGSTFLAVI